MTAWATPSAGMHKQDVADDGRYAEYVRDGGFQQMLPAQAKLFAPDVKPWPTPTINGNDNRVGASPTSGDGVGTIARHYLASVAPDPSRFPVAPSAPGRVQRLKALGNAIVPEAAYWVFRAIDAAERMK